MVLGWVMVRATTIDRFFAHQKKNVKKPLIIGLLFHFQKIDNVFGEKHDIKFDRIFTELGEERF